jgi:hypothetical protein
MAQKPFRGQRPFNVLVIFRKQSPLSQIDPMDNVIRTARVILNQEP